MVRFLIFKKTLLYKYIHIGAMIIGAIIYWITVLGQEDIQILDGEDEHVIFHLPSI